MPKNIELYINQVYLEFLNGVDDVFNYQRNKAKTELVKLYNDLNIIFYKNQEEKCVSIDHINFRMNDLIDAVIVKKREVGDKFNLNQQPNNKLVDEKLDSFKEKFLGQKSEKVLKKS